MIAAIAQGTTRIRNYSTGADCQSTLGVVGDLGIRHERFNAGRVEELHIHGNGLAGLQAPAAMLDAGNSGSTIRMLTGILAAQPFTSRIGGDESLSQRPMGRIIEPLSKMGASILARDGRFPPLEIEGRPLRAVDYTLPVASAQVKSCLLLAGLFADGDTIVSEPVRTRDHTEIALREFGAEVETSKRVITLKGRPRLDGRQLLVPGDLSSAAFFLVAALLARDAELTIHSVGLNPTRTALLDFLASIGANLRVLNLEQSNGELIGDIQVSRSHLRGGRVEKSQTAALIDEIPVLAILGAASEGGLEVRDAAELRVKETDRIATICDNLRRMGISAEEAPDGFTVPGRQQFHAARLDSFGDHRIAMAFAVAALSADGACEIDRAEAASVSYPEFFDTLRRVAG